MVFQVVAPAAPPATAGPTGFAILDLIVRGITLVVVCVSAVLAYRQIKKTQEWNRRKATQDLLFQVATGDMKSLAMELGKEYGVDLTRMMPLPSYASVLATQPDEERKDRLRHLTRSILNYMETVAVGMKNHVLDEDICYEHLSIWLTEYWTFSEELRNTARGKNPTVWIEQEHYVKRWKVRLERENESLRAPGKPRT